MHCILLTLLVLTAPDAATAPRDPIGQQVKDFDIRDYRGAERKLADWKDNQLVVLAFLGVECPLAKLYGPRLAELAAKYEPKGVAFIGVNSNQQDSPSEIAAFARQHKVEFPILKDANNALADQLGAQRTPEVFVLDASRVVRYWGRIDDQYGVGYVRSEPTVHDLAMSLDELLAGKPVTHSVREPVGCYIGRLPHAAPKGDVTYSQHIGPILHKNCVRCHRPGEVAPFSLTSYDEVVGWAATIREAIDTGRMPPWHANPEHGKFWNDARLPDADKRLMDTWVENGCPEGDLSTAPKLPEFVVGWQIPKPEFVYRMPQPFQVPAQGTVEYQHFTIDPGFTEDRWIKAAEARPGNRAVTHHLVVFFHPPGTGDIEPIEPLINSIVGFAPGMPPAIYPDGTYRRVPAGSRIIIQAHYTPCGTPQTDQSEVGFVFADSKEVHKEMTVAAALSWQFRIPAGAASHQVEASHRFDQESLLYTLTPHMHLRGKSFRYVALFPDGREEILLDVPRYDFNWQNTYALAAPKLMPEGTRVRCTATFDNSTDNPANPDPQAAVTWGDQTWQEMMVGTMGVSLANQDLSAGPPVVQPAESGKYDVTFTYLPPGKPTRVYLAGSFNDWKKTGHAMTGPDPNGRFTTTLTLAPGTYEYKFVIDGEIWRPDPGNSVQVGSYKNSQFQVGMPAAK
jgi:peroxiredoxin